MAHDLVHANMRCAVHDNPFLLVCSPLLAALVWRGLADPDSNVPQSVAFTLGLSALAWMVLRNVPGWPLRPNAAAKLRPR